MYEYVYVYIISKGLGEKIPTNRPNGSKTLVSQKSNRGLRIKHKDPRFNPQYWKERKKREERERKKHNPKQMVGMPIIPVVGGERQGQDYIASSSKTLWGGGGRRASCVCM